MYSQLGQQGEAQPVWKVVEPLSPPSIEEKASAETTSVLFKYYNFCCITNMIKWCL